jgi:hypothetical protein
MAKPRGDPIDLKSFRDSEFKIYHGVDDHTPVIVFSGPPLACPRKYPCHSQHFKTAIS